MQEKNAQKVLVSTKFWLFLVLGDTKIGKNSELLGKKYL